MEMILAAHSLGSRDDGVLKLEMCKGDGYGVVRRKIIEGLRNQIGEEGGEIEILQMWHGGYYLNLANLGGRRDFYGVSGDPVLFRYKVKDVGTAAPADTMRIYVETMILETVTLSVRPSDTVNDVRFNLRKNEGISGADQRLSFAGEQLVGSRTLSSYSVRADSTLGLFLSTVKRVVVDTPWGKGIHLEVRSSDTVLDVKRKIKGSDAPPPGKKHLFFAGRQLEDTRTLSHCRVQLFLAGGKLEDGRTLGSQGIEDQSTLLLLESDPEKMQVFVTNPKDKPLVLDVQPSDTIHSLKAKIHDSKGFPPIEQKLYSGNRYLAYGAGTLQSHNIGNGALLRLSVSGILVKTSSGDNLILHPEPSDTLYDVKKLILDRTGVPPEQQVLYQQRPNLSDFHTLSDYNIGDGSILTLGSKAGCSKKRPNFANEADSGCIMKTRVSKDGPKYREVQPGMCLEGKCTNSRCPAFGEMGVLSNDSRNKGFQDYDLARAATRPCSQCRDDVRPTTCAFNNCMWRYEGQKAGEGHTVVGPWTEVGDAYHRFEEHEGVQWKRLLFQARKAQPVLWKAKRARGPVAIDHTYKNCTLCETEVGYGEGELLKCGHWFHGKCIKGWGSGSAIVCPICRKKSRSKEGGF